MNASALSCLTAADSAGAAARAATMQAWHWWRKAIPAAAALHRW